MIKRILIIVLIILVDLAIYFLLTLTMINYEDSYIPEEGPWYSLESMSIQEMLTWFAYQAWLIINVAVIAYLIYRWIKRIKSSFMR